MLSSIKRLVKEALRHRHRSLEDAFAFDIHHILDGTLIRLVDVGAAGGILPRWRPYRKYTSFVGLEPDSRSSAELMQSKEASEFGSYKIIPSGAWQSESSIHISFTRKPMCSSHFQPNKAFLARFPDLQRFDLVGVGEVKCQTLDRLMLEDMDSIVDFIKLDLEGGELAVLSGAQSTLKTCLGLHVEVSFHSIRLEQPLFGDITAYLAEKGLEFLDFVTLCRWERDQYSGVGQAIFSDALYLRSPENMLELLRKGELEKQRANAYLAILVIYERYDLALAFLDLIAAEDLGIKTEYMQRVRNIVEVRKKTFDRRVSFLQKVCFLLSQWSSPNSGLHYLY